LKKSNNEPDDRNWVFLSDWLNWKEQHLKECENQKQYQYFIEYMKITNIASI
jgi:hypothetical protein